MVEEGLINLEASRRDPIASTLTLRPPQVCSPPPRNPLLVLQ